MKKSENLFETLDVEIVKSRIHGDGGDLVPLGIKGERTNSFALLTLDDFGGCAVRVLVRAAKSKTDAHANILTVLARRCMSIDPVETRPFQLALWPCSFFVVVTCTVIVFIGVVVVVVVPVRCLLVVVTCRSSRPVLGLVFL